MNSKALAEQLPYQPEDPQNYRPEIALIGCGGITAHHLRAYRDAGYRVTALCDVDLPRAEARRDEFFPQARVFDDYLELLRIESIEVVDITTHPQPRPALIEAALRAGKHVLSQKPFVLDLDVGQRLCDLADACNVRLAVNQNARWAPHFSYARNAVAKGLLGSVSAAHLSVHWDHTWVRGTPFEQVRHLILYDYAIHWFDILSCFLAEAPRRVFASTARTVSQPVRPALLAQTLIEYDHAQASLAFDAHCPAGSQDRTFLSGDKGALSSVGPSCRSQQLTLSCQGWSYSPRLEGCWFPDGFHGVMGEFLCSIEQRRPSLIDARDNLRSLALCFAAVASADRGQPVRPGEVRALPD